MNFNVKYTNIVLWKNLMITLKNGFIFVHVIGKWYDKCVILNWCRFKFEHEVHV